MGAGRAENAIAASMWFQGLPPPSFVKAMKAPNRALHGGESIAAVSDKLTVRRDAHRLRASEVMAIFSRYSTRLLPISGLSRRSSEPRQSVGRRTMSQTSTR